MEVEPDDHSAETSQCAVPQPTSTPSSDAGQSTSPTSTAPSLLEEIEGIFSVEQLRKDEELLSHMNGRMLVSAQALSKHSKLVATHPTVTADDVVVCGRSTKKFVLEEFPQGCYSLGPLTQAHQKSRCTVSLRLGATPPSEPQKLLCDLIPSRAAAQTLLFHDAPQPRILHYYWCFSSRLVLLTFENDAIAKQAFLDLQSRKLANAQGLEARIRIDNQNAVFYSNQGAAINATTVKPRLPTDRGTASVTPFPAPQNGNVNHMMPPMVPAQFGMLGLPFSPFLFPFIAPPLMQGPQGPRFASNFQQPLMQRKSSAGIGPATDPNPVAKAEGVSTPEVKTHERKPNNAVGRAASTSAAAHVASMSAIPSDASMERSFSFTTPLTPATPADSDGITTPIGTKYRLDPYSQKGRVVQEQRASPTSESLGSPPKPTPTAAPQTIDAFCLPQPRSAALGGAPPLMSKLPRGKPGRQSETPSTVTALSSAQFPALTDGQKANGAVRPLPDGIACVDQKSPTVNTVAVKASYASILLGGSRGETTA